MDGEVALSITSLCSMDYDPVLWLCVLACCPFEILMSNVFVAGGSPDSWQASGGNYLIKTTQSASTASLLGKLFTALLTARDHPM